MILGCYVPENKSCAFGCVCRAHPTATGDHLIKVLIGLATCTVPHCPGQCVCVCICMWRCVFMFICLVFALLRYDMGSSQKPKEGWWRWNLGSPVDLLGARGNQKQTGGLMRCYLICDWYKTLSNWSVLWERWLAGTAVTRSDVCWCVPASSMTFLKMKGPWNRNLSCWTE